MLYCRVTSIVTLVITATAARGEVGSERYAGSFWCPSENMSVLELPESTLITPSMHTALLSRLMEPVHHA